jgi:hypothetical protein
MMILKPALAFLLLSSWSLAHSPRMVSEGAHLSINNAYKVPDSSISWALYAKLPNAQIDWYSFELKKSQELYVSMTVPQISSLENFAPSFAIIGKGLNASKLEFIPSGMGAVVVAASPARLEVHGGHGYWVRQNTTIKAPVAGKYVLAPGRNEVFVNQGQASSAEINAYFAKP